MLRFQHLVLTTSLFAILSAAGCGEESAPPVAVDQWPLSVEGIATDLAVDGAGDVYVLGAIGPGYHDHPEALVKFNSHGDEFWSHPLPGAAWLDNLDVDRQGNAFLSGRFCKPVDFGSGTVLSPDGTCSCLIAKLDRDGDVAWATSYTRDASTPYAACRAAADEHGGVAFLAELGVDAEGEGASRSAGLDMGRIGADGALVWSRNIGGGGATTLPSVAVDGLGNALYAGEIDDFPLTFGDPSFQPGNARRFVAKVDPDGNVQWEHEFASGPIIAATDEPGNVALLISGAHEVDIGGESVAGGSFTLVKFDPAGHVLWSTSATQAEGLTAHGLTIDSAGRVFVVGDYVGSGLQIGTETLPDDTQMQNAFAAAFDASGEPLWSRGDGTPTTVERGVMCGSGAGRGFGLEVFFEDANGDGTLDNLDNASTHIFELTADAP